MKARLSFIFLILPLFIFQTQLSAQELTKSDMDMLVEAHLNDGIDLLREWLSIPNNTSIPGHVEDNVEYSQNAFRSRGFDVNILETGGPPLLLAERLVDPDITTVLFYMHADGQPVDPSKWNQPDPYVPVLKELDQNNEWQIIDWNQLDGEINPDWRVFARASSDDKGPIAMLWQAIDILNTENISPSVNIKVVLDFEEEIGSPHLPDAVEVYKNELAADFLVIFDGPRHQTNLPTLSFGARGIQTMTLTVFGPKTSQHSGHYGNYIPNPARRLSQIIASMVDDDGVVTIPGFYDGVELDESAMNILRAVPDDEESIKQDIGVVGQDSVASFLQAAIQYPSLNIRGMRSGWVGDEVRTIVPDVAIAEIDIRLVKESDPPRLIDLVKNHIEGLGYHILDREPTDAERREHNKLISVTHNFSYGAFRTDIDSDIGNWLTNSLERAFGVTPVRKRTSGGSIPISPFVNTLGIPAVTVPTVNADNNQHSPNENIRLGNYKEGIQTVLSVLTEPVNPF